MEYFQQLDDYLIWFAVAILLLVGEALHGRFMLLAASVAALVVGSLSYFYPLVAFKVQMLFFVVIAAILMWVTNSYIKARVAKISQLQHIYRTRAYVGHEFVLEYPIIDGRGSIELNDLVWRLEGPDCAAGRRVKVVDMGEGYLKVEPVGDH